MKIVFNIKEDDARNPGVIADCTGDNAGDSVGPIGRRLRDLRRHRRRAHHVHPARRHGPERAGPAARLDLRDAHHDGHRVGRLATCINEAVAKAPLRRRRQDELRGAAHRRSCGSPRSSRSALTFVVSLPAHPGPRRRHAVVEALDHHHLRHARRRDHPRARQGLHLDRTPATCARSSRPRARAARRSTSSPASPPVTSRAYWMGLVIVALMGVAYGVSHQRGLRRRERSAHDRPRRSSRSASSPSASSAWARSRSRSTRYGPVTDNAQSVYELSLIENVPERQGRDRRRTSASTSTSRRPSTSSRRTTAPATRSRRPRSRCSSAPPSSARPR